MLTASLFFYAMYCFAHLRSDEQMQNAAIQILNSTRTRSAISDETVLKEFLSLSRLKVYGYDKGGFAVISNDDRFPEVIGYSFTQYRDSMPCGFRWWIESINKCMSKIETISTTHKARAVRIQNSMNPMITTKWGQDRPFNDNCSFTNNGNKYICVTGCIATALAQIMNYHKYPTCGQGSISYDVTYNNDFTITFSENFSQSFYDWDSMLDDYSSYYRSSAVDVHTQAVAKLMKDCGVATKTSFSDATHGSSSNMNNAESALKDYFCYDNSTTYYKRSEYNDEEWMDKIYTELDNRRPILYAGQEDDNLFSSGHAFVLHGYDSFGNVYINWGWDGSYDGYYDLSLLNPGNYSFAERQSMIAVIPGSNTNNMQFYTFTLSSIGNGSIHLGVNNEVEIKNTSKSFSVAKGSGVVLTITIDAGHRIKTFKVDGTDIKSSISDNQYSLNDISKDIKVELEIEEIPPIYTLKYIVDNSDYKTIEIERGSLITPEAEPIKEGYTFSGWSEIPETMPNNNVTVTGTFIINKYRMTYIVDGEEYKSYEIEYGTTVTPEEMPTKDYHTFSGWSDIPLTMPAKDVTITGTFIVNKYKLTYTIDGEIYKTYDIEYGAMITVENNPTKEGYSFSGWSEIPLTMPGNELTITGSFIVNKYILTYMVDSKIYKTYEIEYGERITEEEEPTKEYYTFSGWDYIPVTMPAKDVIIEGTFIVNKYSLTYNIDGKTYRTYEVEYGALIPFEQNPIKEGYTFSGWSDIPETMPGNDFAISGSFIINKYKLSYTVNEEIYRTYDIEYGAMVPIEQNPTKEGYTFSGWSNIPQTMPASDLSVTGSFIINKYKLTYKVDEEEFKTYEIEYCAVITPEAEPTKDGFVFSGWSDIPETMPAEDVVVSGSFSTGTPSIAIDSDGARIYDLQGNRLNNIRKGVNIIRTEDGKVRKVVVK